MKNLLSQLPINIVSSSFYDVLKHCAKKIIPLTIADYKKELPPLSILNAEINANTIIKIAAQNGDIVIAGSKIYSDEFVSYESSRKSSFEIKDNTCSHTKETSIELGNGASIKGQGGAKVQQTKDAITIST